VEVRVELSTSANRMMSSRKRWGGGISPEEVARTMGVDAKVKRLPNRKKQSIEQRKKLLGAERKFTDLIADRDLEDLCTMSKVSFRSAASDALVSAVCFLK
jgi:hypothetical protein